MWSFSFLCALQLSALLSKYEGSIDSSPTHSDHRESISWHVLVPWHVPVPSSVCVPMALSRTGGNERALMLVPVTDVQHHHATACSVCIPLWHCPDGAQRRPAGGPISRESMSVELPRECEWSRLFLEFSSSGMNRIGSRAACDCKNCFLIVSKTWHFCAVECLDSGCALFNLFYLILNQNAVFLKYEKGKHKTFYTHKTML